MANNASNNGWINETLSTHYELVPGCAPGKMELSMAFFNVFENDLRTPSEPYRVQFKAVKAPRHQQSITLKFYARIMSIEHESGSGEAYNLKGYINTAREWRFREVNHEFKFIGWMDARTRTGWLLVENLTPGRETES